MDDLFREEAQRLWEEFDLRYPMFDSNGLFTIEGGRRFFSFVDKFGRDASINIKCKIVYPYREDNGNFPNRFKMSAKGDNWSSENYNSLDMICEDLDERYLHEIAFEDIKDPGCE